MKDDIWSLTWKYPFLIKRPLTQTEIIHKQIMQYFNIMPIVIMIELIHKIRGKVKVKGK
jgi:hypothetical protein